jgi:ketosteroid isomerase-like protein
VGIGRDVWAQVEALHNQQNVAGLPKLYASDAEVIMPDGRYGGIAAIEGMIDASTNGFSDFELETSSLLESDNYVVAEWICRMTHGTGQRVEVRGARVASVRDGKFATYHDYFDMANLASQLGAIATG